VFGVLMKHADKGRQDERILSIDLSQRLHGTGEVADRAWG